MLFNLSLGWWGLSSANSPLAALGRAFEIGFVVLVNFWLGVYT